MKAELFLTVKCPKCEFAMQNDSIKKELTCVNPHCELHGILWKLPTIELERK